MKIKYMLLALMPLCLASCSEEETVVSAGNQREVRVTAGVGAHSRMVLNDKGQYTESLWQSGDEISLFTSTQSNLVYSTSLEGTSASASFTATGESLQYIEGNEVYACYPAAEAIGEGNQLVKLSPNGSFDYNDGTVRSFCYAVDKISKGNLNFKFKHISAFISLTITPEMLGGKSLSYGKIMVSTSSTTPLTIGDGDYFDFTTQTATTVNGGNSLVMTMGHVKDSLGTVYLPVLPQPAGADITITLADSEGNAIYTQTKRTPASGFLAGNVYKLDASASFEVAYLVDGSTFNRIIKNLINGGINNEDYLVGKVQFVTESYNVPERHVVVSAESSSVPVYASFNQGDSLLTISTAAKRMEIIDATSMFISLRALHSIDFGNFIINETTTRMRGMFSGCSSLVSLDLSGFNTSSVIDMSLLFENCSSLSNLDLSSLNTSNVTHMSFMFTGCSSLSSLDLSGFDTSKVTDMQSMFAHCSSLTSLDLSGFNTANVTDMPYMFYYCSSLVSLDLSNFNTSNVTSMVYMFNNCSSLSNLDLSSFNTSNVTSMVYMFENCSSLSILDLSGFDMSNVTSNVDNIGSMFYNCASTSQACKVASTKETKEFLLSKILTTKMNPAWFIWEVDGEVAEVAYLVDGPTFNEYVKMLANANPNLSYDFEDHLIRKIEFVSESSTIPAGHIVVSTVASPVPIYASFNSVDNLLTISTAAKRMEVVDASYMFFRCSSLFGLDLSSFDTSNVTDMRHMFDCCSSLVSLDLSNFDTSNVTDMSDMFALCSSLVSLDLSNFDTSNVTDMSFMFSHCSSLSNLDLSTFDTSNVAFMVDMFTDCSSLSSLDLSSFDTSNVTNMRHMFSSCSSLSILDISNFDMEHVTDMSNMFMDCASTSKACRIICTQETKNFLLDNTGDTEMNPDYFIWGDAANGGSGFGDMSKEEW